MPDREAEALLLTPASAGDRFGSGDRTRAALITEQQLRVRATGVGLCVETYRDGRWYTLVQLRAYECLHIRHASIPF